MRECRLVVNGLSFYVPECTDANVLTAYEWHERAVSSRGDTHIVDDIFSGVREVADQPDGLYVLTPAGELAVDSYSAMRDRVWEERCLEWRKEIADREENNRCRPQ